MTPAQLADAVTEVAVAAAEAGELGRLGATDVPAATVERPRNRDHGDYATNLAMRLAKPAGLPPRAVADLLAVRLGKVEGVDRVDVAGPGFLNLTLADDVLGEAARVAVVAGADYGTNGALTGARLNLEFVSANPTGPVHLGATRWAAVGDALGRLLTASGAVVTREYYFNDAGSQIDRFGDSLLEVAHGRPVPENGYGGAYIADIAAAVVARHPGLLERPEAEQLAVFKADGVELMFVEIRESLEEFGVHFDVYFNERDLHTAGDLDAALALLREGGHVFEADGAVWLRTTTFGDSKDRPLVTSDGRWTYFAADAAYYRNKRARGFDRVVIMLGADHHGYIGRYRALVAALGDDPDRNLEILIGQMVNLVRDGTPVRMSKRAGTLVLMTDMVEAIGVDAARYALARYDTDQPIDIDLDLWSSRRNDNPVYYVQYAHARLSKLQRDAAAAGIPVVTPDTAADVDVSLLVEPRETALLAAIAEFPQRVAGAAELRAPHRIARYLEEVAGLYHRFYDGPRILPRDTDEPTPAEQELTRARLLLGEATRVVLAAGLALLGVTAPERM
ncbi:arginine--tRNA ligase [Jatrophihabitans sp. YIM 134969]